MSRCSYLSHNLLGEHTGHLYYFLYIFRWQNVRFPRRAKKWLKGCSSLLAHTGGGRISTHRGGKVCSNITGIQTDFFSFPSLFT